eukprot:1429652-Amphidinium_carterae.1
MQRQAVLQDIPQEVIQQATEVRTEPAEVRAKPAEDETHTLDSSTSTSTSDEAEAATGREEELPRVRDELHQSPEDDDEIEYWDNVVHMMKENWLEGQLITVYKDLHEVVLYWMDETHIELLHYRSQQQHDEEATRDLKVYQSDMDKLYEQLWKQLEERNGKLSENEVYIKAWDTRDEATMEMVCYNYFKAHRELRNEWRKVQIETDIKKNE